MQAHATLCAAVALACALSLVAADSSAPAPLPEFELPNPLTELPIIPIPVGKRLEELPGRSVLVPEGPRTSINITLTPATLLVSSCMCTLGAAGHQPQR